MAKKSKKSSPKNRRRPVQKKKVKKKATKAVTTRMVVPDAVVAGLQDNIRLLAGHMYMASNLSIAQLAKTPELQGINIRVLEGWSVKDEWVAKRHEFQDRVKIRVQNVLASEVARERSNQMKDIVSRRNALSKLVQAKLDSLFDADGDLLPEASDEKLTSLVNTWIKVTDLADKFLDKLGEEFFPAAADAAAGIDELQAASSIRPQLTQEEARAAAKLLIKMRRDEMRRLS